ncbi:hypothetical protein GZH47_13560 [Paenibacillus rhizovicinus]|uniref:Nucleotidyltransferase domain-containing protein n=2 Tax=Paenibacillus rhizovicinus TaxID=2704463 RepID=A0A6C0P929_9BACL|nr:hypothetical protein GZH47_13560 [Paenibacillus rhizovicinus]
MIARETILDAIVSTLGSEDYLLAIWLEGSDGTNSLDAYSDIDLVCYTKEGCTDEAFARLDLCLAELGPVDMTYEQPNRPNNNRYKVYHLQDSSEHLLLDVTMQSESFPVSFLKEDKTVVPVVLLDKAGVVTYQNIDRAAHRAQLRAQLDEALGVFSQRSRAVKYTQRGHFLEALIYYQKYVLNPLVDVLRIVYTPIQSDCFLVHASRDFPADVVRTLESLYGVKTVQDIAEGIDRAEEWFRRAAAKADEALANAADEAD